MKHGTYYYAVLNPSDNTYTRHFMRVEIIGETVKSYHVRYLSYHHNGTAPGYTTWVQRRQ